MKRIATHLTHTLWLATLSFLIVLAVLVSLFRLATPLVEKQKPTIEHWLSAALNKPVTIGELKADWSGLQFSVVAMPVIVNDAQGHPLFKIDEFHARINLLKSLLSAHLSLGDMSFIGAQLSVSQDKKGIYSVNGWALNQSDQPMSAQTKFLLSWIFSESHIILQSIQVNAHNAAGDALPLQSFDVSLRNQGNQHRLSGILYFSKHSPQQLNFILDTNSDWEQLSSARVNVYAQANAVDLPAWLPKTVPIKTGNANIQLWAVWQQQQLKSLQGLFQVNQLQLATQKPFGITALLGNVYIYPEKDGYFSLTSDMAAKNTVVDFGPLFRAPIPLKSFSAHVQLQPDFPNDTAGKPDWILQATHVNAQNDDAQVSANLSLLFPADGESPTMGLLAAAHIMNAKNIGNYLPLPVMSPAIVDWLDRSVKSVNSADSVLVVNGKLADFPFDNNSGKFIVDTHINGAELDYWPEWPALTQLSGDLVFSGRNMDFILQSGKIGAITLQNAHVEIPEIKKEAQSILNIDSVLNTDLEKGLEFLRQTPLDDGVLNTVKKMQGQGAAQLGLHLTIPLEDGKQNLQVLGHLNLPNNQLAIPENNIQLSNLKGALNFTQAGVNAKSLSAQLWGKPLALSMAATGGVTSINLAYDGFKGVLKPGVQSSMLSFSGEGLSGQARIPNDKTQPLQINFPQIDMNRFQTGTIQQWNLSDIPRLNLIIGNLKDGARNFGRLQLSIVPTSTGLLINNLNARNPVFAVNANGTWSANRTRFQGSLSSNDISSALKSWGFPTGLLAKNTDARFNLNWPGSPYDFDLGKMTGNFSLHFTQGEIDNLSSGSAVKMGIGRLLTLTSWQSLNHYLKLDFSGLTAAGFTFDDMKGDFSLTAGNAYTQNTMINGQVADVVITGRIGLATKDYDLRLQVTPKLTSSLPMIAGLIGGPVVGGATWLAGKILNPAVQHISTDHYRIVGPWANPKVVKIA